MTEPLFFAGLAELRDWLGSYDGTEVWLGFPLVRYGVARTTTLTVAAAAEVLAERGWVESGRRTVDAGRYAVRFAPGAVPRRRAAPAWTREPGGVEMPELAAPYDEELRANAAAWEFFERQSPKYRRTAIWWVMGGKAEETRRRRLAALVEGSAAGERLAQLQRQM